MPQKPKKRVHPRQMSSDQHRGKPTRNSYNSIPNPLSTPSSPASSHGHGAHRRAESSSKRVSTADVSGVHLRNDQAFEVSLPGGKGVQLTRRQFLYGAAGVAGAALLCAGGVAVSQAAAAGQKTVSTLKVAESQVSSSDDCSQIDDGNAPASLLISKKLPYGTMVWSNCPEVAACLLATDNVNPLVQVGLLDLSSGNLNTVLKQAVGQAEGFDIYDVRACTSGIIWAEADIMNGRWRVYSASGSVSSINTPLLLQEGDNQWEMPTLAAAGDYAWWQVIPRLDGNATTEASKLYRARFGTDSIEEVYSSNGRMCTPIYALEDAVVITPRADTNGTYYQLTHIDAKSGSVTDALTLPASMTPLEAGYGPNGFTFSFDVIYNYGGGIANLGTYTPTEPVSGSADPEEAAANYSAADWFRFARTPSAPPAWCDRWFIVKSTQAVCGVDLESMEYFILDVENGVDDYGDYLATTGSQKRFVTYSNVDYTPIGGETVHHTLVRVWEIDSSSSDTGDDDESDTDGESDSSGSSTDDSNSGLADDSSNGSAEDSGSDATENSTDGSTESVNSGA